MGLGMAGQSRYTTHTLMVGLSCVLLLGFIAENNNKNLEGSLHTYQDEFFKEMIYLSDSAGSDIKKKLLELNLSSLTKTIQMLTHPIWWASNSNSPTDTLNKWLEKHQAFIISETSKNCKSFKP